MNNSYSLESIYTAQIEEFKKLKKEQDQISKEKWEFWYEEKLKELEWKKKAQLDELKTSSFSDSVKDFTAAAIEEEFNTNKGSLKKEIEKFDEAEFLIKEKKHQLRGDELYQKAMGYRHEIIQAERTKNQLENKKSLMEHCLKEAEEALEKAKKKFEETQNSVNSIDKSINEVDKELAETKSQFTKKIVIELTNQDKVLNAIEALNWTVMDIDISKYNGQKLWNHIKHQIFLQSRISYSWGNYRDDLNDNILIIDSESIPQTVSVWETFPVTLYYWDWKECQIIINIVGKISEKNSTPENNSEGERIQTEHEKHQETVWQIIKGIHSNGSVNKNVLFEFKSYIETWWDSAEMKVALHNLTYLYELHGEKDIVIQKVFEMPLSLSQMYVFIDKAYKKAYEMTESKENPFELFNHTKATLHKKSYKRSEKLEIMLLQFWLSLPDIWINDVPKSRHLRWWTCNWK